MHVTHEAILRVYLLTGSVCDFDPHWPVTHICNESHVRFDKRLCPLRRSWLRITTHASFNPVVLPHARATAPKQTARDHAQISQLNLSSARIQRLQTSLPTSAAHFSFRIRGLQRLEYVRSSLFDRSAVDPTCDTCPHVMNSRLFVSHFTIVCGETARSKVDYFLAVNLDSSRQLEPCDQSFLTSIHVRRIDHCNRLPPSFRCLSVAQMSSLLVAVLVTTYMRTISSAPHAYRGHSSQTV